MLKISDSLPLPLEAITQTLGILAVRGAGKSNLAAVMAEEMFDAHLPFVVIDPVGAWWGMRSSGDGRSPGIPIPIFGGLHGDVPLERAAGNLVADLIVDNRLSCIVDISEFSEGDKVRFLCDFAERLYRRNTDPLHLFLEEADDYAPQRPMREQARLLRAWENIVRRGRSRGLGITMITQRSAALNKNVLTQIETLFVLRTTSPQDRKAIAAWVEYYDQSRDLLESLAGLANGEAWVWSPQFLKTVKRVKVRRRQTFDSAATPKHVKGGRKPATLADVDLAMVKERMAATIERVKEDDPRELRRRIGELQRQLQQAHVATPKPEIQRIEVAVITDEQLKRLEFCLSEIKRLDESLGLAVNTLGKTFSEAAFEIIEGLKAHRGVQRPEVRSVSLSAQRRPSISHPVMTRRADSDISLRNGERRMLQELARRYPIKLTRAQLGTMAGFTPRGGTFGNYFGNLKRATFITEAANGDVEITQAGLDYLGTDVPPAPATTVEMIAMWKERLRAGEAKMLDILVGEYPHAMSRERLGELAGFTASGGTFGNYLGTLRRNGLIEVAGDQVRANDTLFIS